MKRTALLIASCILALGAGCGGGEGRDHDDHAARKGHEEHEVHDGDDHKGDDHKGDDHKGDDHKGDDHKGDAHGSDHARAVRIAPEAARRSGVRVVTVSEGALAGAFEVPAEVQLNPDRVAHISPLVDGQLISVNATLGDRVEAGAQLARLRSVVLGQARAELSRTTSLREVARLNRNRQRRLRREGISSERSLLEAELAYTQADAERGAASSRLRVFGLRGGGSGPDMALESPIAGVIVERHATRGENVAPDDTLFVVADVGRVWVIGSVYERQIARVVPGMSATLTLNAYPERVWSGTVGFVGAALDETTRTLPIRVEIDNDDGLLRPGLFGALRLASGGSSEAASVLVPAVSVQTVEGQAVVFVPGDAEGAFEAQPVVLGRESAQWVEVREGLEPGARVVAEGAFVLKSELMRGELGHGHAH